MEPQEQTDTEELQRQRKGARKTALIIAAIALGIYIYTMYAVFK